MKNVNEVVKISICVPAYNRPELTLRALVSVKNQTVKPYEVLVHDDRSQENMAKVAAYCKANGFNYRVNEKNLGLIGNINSTILTATGNIWCCLHNDDLLSPYYVENCIKIVKTYPELSIWVTNGCAINCDDKVINEFRLFHSDTIIQKLSGLRTLYSNGYNTILSIIGSTIYRTEFMKTHLFDENMGNEADLDRALYFLANYDMKYIDVPIYFTRIHGGQESRSNKINTDAALSYISHRISIYRKYDETFKIKNFLIPVLGTHFLQLLLKYHMHPKKISRVLGLSGWHENVLIMLSIIQLANVTLWHKLHFMLHRNKINKYNCWLCS